jgi:hypothetical protein
MAQTKVNGFTKDLNGFGRIIHVATATVGAGGGMTQAKMDAVIQSIHNLNYSITGIEGFTAAATTAIHVAYEGGAAIANDSSDALGATGCAWAGVVSFSG